jgi:adenine C2-methylase RlmN of 23S rRNA A2503 and tRNA A37
MEIYRTKDNLVSKFIHEDGSETAIKTVKSIINKQEKEKIKIEEEDRNKYSIFISISTGCQFKCQFCYLTMKNSEYKKLEYQKILNNIKEALKEEIKHKPELKDKYVKLSWMGMGDAFNQSDIVLKVTIELLDWIIENKYAKGLDGVDLSTIFPKTNKNWKEDFYKLEKELQKYDINPKSFIKDNENKEYTSTEKYNFKRSRFRLFYSLGSAIEEQKQTIIPFVINTNEAIKELIEYSKNNKHNLIIHHMFIENLNSSEEDIKQFINFIKENNLEKYEIRILRYNYCDKSKFQESDYFENIIKQIYQHIPNLKVQISAGNEVKAACGQFIVKKWK